MCSPGSPLGPSFAQAIAFEFRYGAEGAIHRVVFDEPEPLEQSQWAAYAARAFAGFEQWAVCASPSGRPAPSPFQQMVSDRVLDAFRQHVSDAEARLLDLSSSPRLVAEASAASTALASFEAGAVEALIMTALSVVDPILHDQIHRFRTEQGWDRPLDQLMGPDVIDGLLETALAPDEGAMTNGADRDGDASGSPTGHAADVVVAPSIWFGIARTISESLDTPSLAEARDDLAAALSPYSVDELTAAAIEATKADPDRHGALQTPSTAFEVRLLGGDTTELFPTLTNVAGVFATSATLTGGSVLAAERIWEAGAAGVGKAAGVIGLAAEAARALAADRSLVLLEFRDRNSPAFALVDAALIDMPFGTAEVAKLRTTEFVPFETAEPTTLGQILASHVSIADGLGTYELVFSDVISPVEGPMGLPVPIHVDLSESGLGTGTFALGGGVGELMPAGATVGWAVEQPERVAEAGSVLHEAMASFVESLVEAGYDLLTDDGWDAGVEEVPDGHDDSDPAADVFPDNDVGDRADLDEHPESSADVPDEPPPDDEDPSPADDDEPPPSWFEDQPVEAEEDDPVSGAFDDVFPVSTPGEDLAAGHGPDPVDHAPDAPSSAREEPVEVERVVEDLGSIGGGPDGARVDAIADPISELALECPQQDSELAVVDTERDVGHGHGDGREEANDRPDGDDGDGGDSRGDGRADADRGEGERSVEADDAIGASALRRLPARPSRPQRVERPSRPIRG